MGIPKAASSPGAIFQIELGAQFAYVQFIEKSLGDVVRVLPGIYRSMPDLKSLAAGPELDYALVKIHRMARTGDDVKYVGTFEIPPFVPRPQAFLMQELRDGRCRVWIEGREEKVCLPPEVIARMPRFSIPGLPHFLERIYELNGRVAMAPEATGTGGPSGVTHYASFTDENAAREAKGSIERGFTNITVTIEDQEPDDAGLTRLQVLDGVLPPKPERLVATLAEIIRGAGGKYEGFDAPIE